MNNSIQHVPGEPLRRPQTPPSEEKTIYPSKHAHGMETNNETKAPSRHERITAEYRVAVANPDNQIDVVRFSRDVMEATVTFRIRFGYGVLPPNDGMEDD